MKTSEYLYGKSLDFLANMSYKEALETKIKLANKVISIQQQVNYKHRDIVRINDCLKAIKFNEKLLEELK